MRPARILVINQRGRPDRLAAFAARWAAVADQAFDVITAVDLPTNPGRGCYESHLIAMFRAGTTPTLIMEDDAVFRPTFTLDLPEPPPRWQLLRLGGLLRAAADPPGGDPIAPPRPWVGVGMVHHTHAYVTARPDLLAAMVRARPGADIGAALCAGIPGHYRLTPATVGQAAGASTISGDRDRPADEFWD